MVASQSKGRTNDYFTWKQAGEDVTSTLSHRVKGGPRKQPRPPLSPPCPSCLVSPLWLSSIGGRTSAADGCNKNIRPRFIQPPWLRHILYFHPTRNATGGNLPLDWASIPAKLGSRDSLSYDREICRRKSGLRGWDSGSLTFHATLNNNKKPMVFMYSRDTILKINFFFFFSDRSINYNYIV